MKLSGDLAHLANYQEGKGEPFRELKDLAE